jgi:hypothetical protein
MKDDNGKDNSEKKEVALIILGGIAVYFALIIMPNIIISKK